MILSIFIMKLWIETSRKTNESKKLNAFRQHGISGLLMISMQSVLNTNVESGSNCVIEKSYLSLCIRVEIFRDLTLNKVLNLFINLVFVIEIFRDLITQ